MSTSHYVGFVVTSDQWPVSKNFGLFSTPNAKPSMSPGSVCTCQNLLGGLGDTSILPIDTFCGFNAVSALYRNDLKKENYPNNC
jgi:hypothetical protein